MKEIYNTYDSEVINLHQNYQQNYPKNSTTIRISILEDRTKSLEKMLRLLEDRLNLKEEEKFTELKTFESNNAIISKLNKKIKNLENKLNDITIQKQKMEEENKKTISELNDRIKILEEKIKFNSEESESMEDTDEIKTNKFKKNQTNKNNKR